MTEPENLGEGVTRGRQLFGQVTWCVPHDCAGCGGGQRFTDRFDALQWLLGLGNDPELLSNVRQALAVCDDIKALWRVPDDEVREQLADRLARGQVLLCGRAGADTPGGSKGGGGTRPPPAPVPPAPRPPRPAPTPPPRPEPEKSITGRFKEETLKCGSKGKVLAQGVNISGGAKTTFAIARVRDKGAAKSVSAPMNGQAVNDLDWDPRRPADWQAGDVYAFDVSADGVSNKSSNTFKFHEYPVVAAETKTFNCTSGVFGWTGKFDIAFANDTVTVTVKVKLVNRLGAKPANSTDPLPAIGDPVTDADKASMKADIEGKLSNKVSLIRKNCQFGAACSCPKPIKIVVQFVESGEHHLVNLFQGSGRANSSNWTRVKTRANSWAHETGHLLAWFDEYTGGAVGTAPRWKPNEPANVMNVGLTVPPEYAWDFRDWYAGKSGEDWVAK